MKKIIIPILMGMVLCCQQLPATGQSYSENISKEFTVEKAAATTLFIYNIDGFIKVEGYAGNKVQLEMAETITADDNKTLETGKQEFKLGFEQKQDSIIAYIAAPFDSRPCNNCNCCNRDIRYNYRVNFTVKVPMDMNLHISTVNNGNITVSNVGGELYVNNVNGTITVSDAKGTTLAHTVNGDVTVNYVSNPPEQSSYHTINGNIHVGYKPDLSADLQFKSMHGDFYTDFPDAELMPMTTTKKEEANNGGTVYKINKNTVVRFGKGGKVFKFETLNGNVYIKKQS